MAEPTADCPSIKEELADLVRREVESAVQTEDCRVQITFSGGVVLRAGVKDLEFDHIREGEVEA